MNTKSETDENPCHKNCHIIVFESQMTFRCKTSQIWLVVRLQRGSSNTRMWVHEVHIKVTRELESTAEELSAVGQIYDGCVTQFLSRDCLTAADD